MIRNAEFEADRYLENDDAIGIHHRDIEAFRYLDLERAALLITVSFERCTRAVWAHDMPYATGNDIGRLFVAFGRAFVPDVR